MTILNILVVLLCASFALSASVLKSPRTVVPFQYAWRFHYGDDPSSPPEAGPGHCSTAFEESLQDYSICEGMERNPNRFSEKDCRMACCYDPTCMAWQAYPLALNRMCFHAYKGMNISCSRPQKPTGIGGGRRSKPPSPPFRTDYSFATADASSTIDSDWAVVDAPHDFIAEYANFTDDVTNFKQGYLPRNASWYRKHFKLPRAWQSDGGSTHLHFEGVFHHATIFLNGEYVMSHECGYTGFTVRIDNATKIRFGQVKNVIAVRTDASFGSGHWYEGGGIYRPVHLVHVPSATHIVHDGLFVTPETNGAAIKTSVELEQILTPLPSANKNFILVRFILLSADGQVVHATNTTAPFEVKTAGTTYAYAELTPVKPLTPWSSHNPVLYTVRAEVLKAGEETILDSLEVEAGFRTTSWADQGQFTLNNEQFKLRGFSHHNSIGGLGVAIPERIQLFRVQASRALGSNIWRMSHNPYVPALYRLLDITGLVCWDENRDYGAKYMDGAYTVAMRDMVKRDRNHPSIIIWSFCNEYECQQNDPDYSADKYRFAAYSVDGTRPVTANDITYGSPQKLDVQGGSHTKNQSLAKYHGQYPSKPLVLSECCSCMSQRPERDLPSCIAQENSPGLLPYVSGSLGVWTLMDYFGEPHGTGTSAWPYVSSDFGQFDMAGFPKPHAYWYNANWLQSFSTSSAGRPTLPARTVTRVLSLLPAGGLPMGATVETITTAPFAELFLNGVSMGVAPSPVNDLGEFDTMNWTSVIKDKHALNGVCKNATLVALSAMSGGKILGKHTVIAPSTNAAVYGIQVTLDVPSVSTGTGRALLLNGRDTAMVRAAIIDVSAGGALVSSARNRITWRVVSGPGTVAGISNGDPTSHEWMKNNAVNTFGGLARGLFRVTQDCTSVSRDLATSIDVDRSLTSIVTNTSNCKTDPIVVEAFSSGLAPARVSIPVSVNVAQDDVFSVASQPVAKTGFSYLDDFVG